MNRTFAPTRCHNWVRKGSNRVTSTDYTLALVAGSALLLTMPRARTLFLISLAWTAMTTSPVVNADSNPYLKALPYWAVTLQRFVDDQGRTDFHRLAHDATDLKAFAAALIRVSPMTHPNLFPTTEDALAYHINSYNAHAMLGVLDRGIPEGFTSFFKRASFFRFRDIYIGAVRTNLHSYENKVIRPLGDARVHFALNCMVKDCPRLPREPFVTERLEDQLQAATEEFLNSAKHVQLDHANKLVNVSAILDFYTVDFVPSGDRDDLIPYINRYRADPIPESYDLEFLKYDWRINKTP